MKTITLLTTFTIAVSVLISGCSMTDPAPDLDKFVNALGGLGGGGTGTGNGSGSALDANGQPYSFYGPTVWMDSLAHENDSTAIFWGHYQYDSVLIIQKSELTYTEFIIPVPADRPEFSNVFQSKPDTIDFRTLHDSTSTPHKEWIYKFSVRMDSLKSNTPYLLSVVSDYLFRKDDSRRMTTGGVRYTK